MRSDACNLAAFFFSPIARRLQLVDESMARYASLQDLSSYALSNTVGRRDMPIPGGFVRAFSSDCAWAREIEDALAGLDHDGAGAGRHLQL